MNGRNPIVNAGSVSGDAIAPGAALLETLLWTPETGYFLLKRHMDRLGASAAALGYTFAEERVVTELRAVVAGTGKTAVRVRLLLDRDGSARIECRPLDASATPSFLRVAWAPEPVDSQDPRLRHKTTDRAPYARARAVHPDADDVIMYNTSGEATESTIANLVVERDGRWVTPPLHCGLLAGTFRAELLARGEIEEETVPVAALRSIDKFWLINSVRRWMPATWLSQENS
jgi:para-aminobenzoate synthetase/4-amino-4-deoxychorismate lyase